MKISLSLFKKLKISGIKSRLTDADMIFAGAIFLLVILAIFVVIDAYLFYAMWSREHGMASPSPASFTLSTKEIDEVIKLLDQREQEYRDLLNAR